MPKLRSAKKTLRNRIKATERNRAIRSRMRTAIKRVHQASDKTTAETALQSAISVVDKTARKGILHKNTAARYKSRLHRFVQTIA
ncbi:MAG: 30S ribosomal protein S20 [Gemmatimonadetes bacterium]|nr:30S ribosomal protein S20 [Gemmatimonadota bacterium]MDE0963429.1 30S ribosomal protein S20 [Candidatus Latescibacterota bacterium]MBT5329592.1 30S ribosomal protein S20 [Gemmatimonadota bacterium]MBT5449957.1 30S ribosomal protein S20 [Gemmatimonadota bacterium]MBT5803415.1 30S ribosomal protein S20 [Gemmatimonadota bacterium]